MMCVGNDIDMVAVSAIDYFIKTGAPAKRITKGSVTEWWNNNVCIGKMNYNAKKGTTFWLNKKYA